ncbi:hypothetical protein FVB9288_02306 [Flavobacterium sp. CECT 9288]|nr:hypothetical protein FVB9288_02306 [Flavobacterium sp. CECT 9288]
MKNIGDITIFTKIKVFNKTYYSEDFIGYLIENFRIIKNEGLNLCKLIKNLENEIKSLNDFLKQVTFYYVNCLVYYFGIKIKENL